MLTSQMEPRKNRLIKTFFFSFFFPFFYLPHSCRSEKLGVSAHDYFLKTRTDLGSCTGFFFRSASVSSLSALMQQSIKSKQPTSHFANMYGAFRALLNFFYGEQVPSNSVDGGGTSTGAGVDSLARLARALRLYSCGASTLVSLYYAARYRQQRQLAPGDFPCGSVSARILLQGRRLRVEVLNARHLKPLEVLLARSDPAVAAAPHDLRVLNQQQQQQQQHALDSMTTCSSSSSSAYSSAHSYSTTSSSGGATSVLPAGRLPPRPKPRQKLLIKQQQQHQQQQQQSELSRGGPNQISRILQSDQGSRHLALPSPSTTLLQQQEVRK